MEELLAGLKRSKYCGEFTSKDIGKKVTAMGFVAKYRNLGSIQFIDLRDRTGIVQISFDEANDAELFKKSTAIRNEFIIAVCGEVRARGEKNVNKDISSGEVEIIATALKIISEAEVTPFNIVDNSNTNEQLRLKYRYLDLRRLPMQKRLIIRDKIVQSTRRHMAKQGFMDIETPFLGKSTPEGARDYLVPSRVQNGKFYALPQSPQLYKQMLMISGFDKYYQIARCFRDEDLRANRQPEFSQIDIEMSFVDSIDDVLKMAEGLIKSIFKDTLNISLKGRFKRLKYKDAMNKYGSDKPDTRFALELNDISSIVKGSDFSVFDSVARKRNHSVRGINAKSLANNFTRKQIDKLQEFVRDYGAKWLAYIIIKEDEISSPIKKFFSDEKMQEIISAMQGEVGDILFFVADRDDIVFDSLGALRLKIAKEFALFDSNVYDILWVTDFPLFEYDETEKRLVAKHHPFTAPKNEDIDKLDKNPLKAKAKAYDLVINGEEAGGGSIRIHQKAVQRKMFEMIGLSEKDITERFGFFVEAFKYGVPPHGGIAFGLDRLTMLIAKTDNIKDVIAFPKIQNASCLLQEAPSFVENNQLKELGIDINK